MYWDFISLRPETTHQVSFLFSDRGTPDGFRHMDGFGSHTFAMVNKGGQTTWVKFHFKTDQGIKNLSTAKADELAGSDPDYATRDLFNSIASGAFPSWSLSIQAMTPAQAEKASFNPFDVTKVWSQKEYPLIPVAKMVFNRNPSNYFTDVEQLAFSPAHMVPGIEPSPDKMLQGRLFSYSDTHMHRLGVNFQQLPVNCPYQTRVQNYQRDGPARADNNQGGAPNYFPNSFNGPQPVVEVAARKWTSPGDIARYETADEDNFSQVTTFYTKVLDEGGRDRLTTNIAGHLGNAAPFIQQRQIDNFNKVSPDYGKRVADKIAARRAKF